MRPQIGEARKRKPGCKARVGAALARHQNVTATRGTRSSAVVKHHHPRPLEPRQNSHALSRLSSAIRALNNPAQLWMCGAALESAKLSSKCSRRTVLLLNGIDCRSIEIRQLAGLADLDLTDEEPADTRGVGPATARRNARGNLETQRPRQPTARPEQNPLAVQCRPTRNDMGIRIPAGASAGFDSVVHLKPPLVRAPRRR